MIERSPSKIITRCNELARYWAPRNAKMKFWYRLIQMVDELKTEKMESFVGNDPRSMFNLILHMLDAPIPHRLRDLDVTDFEVAAAGATVSDYLEKAWADAQEQFRKSGPRQSLKRTAIGLLLATGWYSIFALNKDDGSGSFIDVWNPAQAFPMWDIEAGLSEVAHVYPMDAAKAKKLVKRIFASEISGITHGDVNIYDYWWLEIADEWPFQRQVWNAVVVGNSLVKFEATRFKKIPVYVAPVGGLPDTGPLSEGTELSSSYNAGGQVKGERWKEEIGQSILATNENIYRVWNKWWSFSLQLLRDTAQPRVFERSRGGKVIVKPEDVFKRGAIFRGGPDDSVEFIGAPPMPLELRSTQLDLEAMMQRGGPSWAMYGNVTGQMTAYVMSQIAASANQVMRPFHQAVQDFTSDIDNDLLTDVRDRGINPYGFHWPQKLDKNTKVTAEYEVEIPGELIQKATVARMLDPQFALSYSYVVNRLFPDIKNPLQERARRLADQAELSPETAIIAQVRYYRMQAAFLSKSDAEAARLYELAAEAAEAQITPAQQQPARGPIGNRPEGLPTTEMPQMPV